jgi:hypothetical protein
MILYRLADPHDDLLFPPVPPTRDSTSGDSFVSLSADSKYPAGTSFATERGLIAYPYDPFVDDPDATDDDIFNEQKGAAFNSNSGLSSRGLWNLTVLLLMLAALLSLFIVYPVFIALHDNGRSLLIVGNARINSTGQAEFVDVNPRDQIPILWVVWYGWLVEGCCSVLTLIVGI